MKVLNIGSLNLDHVYQVDHFVQPGETLSADASAINPGGKGLNQSIALARAGACVFHAGCLGTGGSSLKALLEENGVNTSWLKQVEELQGNAMIQVNKTGENCIILFGGSNQCITKDQAEETIEGFEEGDYLVLQNEVNELPYLVDQAYARGMKIVLNPSPFNDRLLAVDYSKISWLLMNEVETEQLSGSGKPEAAWELLHAKYPNLSVIITLGKAGSVGYRCTEGGVEHVIQEAYPADAVDTTAAGDTYTGFLIAGLLENRPLKECMQRASLASAISVTRPGAAGSIPTREEVDRAYEQL